MQSAKKLTVRHIELGEANVFIGIHHRHHKKVISHRFSLGAFNENQLVGVAVVSRPVAREIDQCNVVEVTRLCTDGTYNACSLLYGACRRAAKALGYKRIITYILEGEVGTSLKASGWIHDRTTAGGSWDTPSRRRTDKHPICPKKRYVVDLI
jgi:hypothetical protein